MSTTKSEFPRHRDFNDPPPVKGELVNGQPTPQYALAWVCPEEEFFESLGCENTGNFTIFVRRKWNALPKSDAAPGPRPYFAPDGTFYLIAMSNKPHMKHLERAKNPNDPVIQAARVAMGVDKHPSLEETLMWYRWPLDWIGDKVRAYYERLGQMDAGEVEHVD